MKKLYNKLVFGFYRCVVIALELSKHQLTCGNLIVYFHVTVEGRIKKFIKQIKISAKLCLGFDFVCCLYFYFFFTFIDKTITSKDLKDFIIFSCFHQ